MTKPLDLVCLKDGQPVTTSLIIAEHFTKEHKDVLRAIKNLDCSRQFHERNFALMFQDVEIANGATRQSAYYQMTRDGFSFLCMGFTGKNAAIWKENYIDAFNRLEKQATTHVAQREALIFNLKDKLMSQHLRYRQVHRYLQRGFSTLEMARCLQISDRAVRKILSEMRELELLPEQEVFVFAHTGRIARHVPHQLGLLGD